MKKILAIALTWALFSTVSISQTTASTKDSKATCIPTKECAAKAGVSLEECKKICSSKADASATTSVASASMVSDTEAPAKKCCASKKACTSKTAMKDSETESKVASAVKVNQIEEVTAEKTPAKTCAKTCTKKKG